MLEPITRDRPDFFVYIGRWLLLSIGCSLLHLWLPLLHYGYFEDDTVIQNVSSDSGGLFVFAAVLVITTFGSNFEHLTGGQEGTRVSFLLGAIGAAIAVISIIMQAFIVDRHPTKELILADWYFPACLALAAVFWGVAAAVLVYKRTYGPIHRNSEPPASRRSDNNSSGPEVSTTGGASS